ncbi:hypothetical protein P9112_007081 [Eukaryota sp. TZLM1-RC]
MSWENKNLYEQDHCDLFEQSHDDTFNPKQMLDGKTATEIFNQPSAAPHDTSQMNAMTMILLNRYLLFVSIPSKTSFLQRNRFGDY